MCASSPHPPHWRRGDAAAARGAPWLWQSAWPGTMTRRLGHGIDLDAAIAALYGGPLRRSSSRPPWPRLAGGRPARRCGRGPGLRKPRPGLVAGAAAQAAASGDQQAGHLVDGSAHDQARGDDVRAASTPGCATPRADGQGRRDAAGATRQLIVPRWRWACRRWSAARRRRRCRRAAWSTSRHRATWPRAGGEYSHQVPQTPAPRRRAPRRRGHGGQHRLCRAAPRPQPEGSSAAGTGDGRAPPTTVPGNDPTPGGDMAAQGVDRPDQDGGKATAVQTDKRRRPPTPRGGRPGGRAEAAERVTAAAGGPRLRGQGRRGDRRAGESRPGGGAASRRAGGCRPRPSGRRPGPTSEAEEALAHGERRSPARRLTGRPRPGARQAGQRPGGARCAARADLPGVTASDAARRQVARVASSGGRTPRPELLAVHVDRSADGRPTESSVSP